MNFIKKLFFILSSIAVHLSVKTGAQDEVCGTYSSLSGTISSPNYPSNYNNSLNCYYYIQPPDLSKSVNITFISFATELNHDWLEVYCDNTDNVRAFTGSTLPPFLSISSCSKVALHFYTDGATTYQGFNLSYAIGNGLQGGLTMKPTNHYVRSDRSPTEPTILSCSSRENQSGVYPWWSFGTIDGSFRDITAPDCSVLSSSYYIKPTYFSTSGDYSTRTCNLTISPHDIYSAVGFYMCTDATLDYAVVLVDAVDPSFTVTPSEVVQGEQISMTCNVSLLPEATIYFNLTPSVYIYSGNNQRPNITSSNTASINVTASAELPSSYVCNINFTLSISQDKNRPSKYDTTLPQNIYLNLTSPRVLGGNFTTATTVSSAVPVSQKNEPEDKSTLNSVALVVGVVLGVAVLILLVVAIVEFVLLRRKKNSAPEDEKYDYIEAVTKTDADPSKNNSYEMTHRRSLDVNQGGAVAASGHKHVASMYDKLTSQTYDTAIQGAAVPTSGHKDVAPPPLPPMHERVTDKTYDTEIHAEDESQPYLELYR